MSMYILLLMTVLVRGGFFIENRANYSGMVNSISKGNFGKFN